MCVCVCERLCASLCTAQSEASSSCKLYHLISSDPAFVCPMAGLEGRSELSRPMAGLEGRSESYLAQSTPHIPYP